VAVFRETDEINQLTRKRVSYVSGRAFFAGGSVGRQQVVKKFRLYFCGVTNKKSASISTKGAKR